VDRIALDRAWVEGANPWKLPRPSDWWLQQLIDYDYELVLMPGVKDYCYRLCRRPNPDIYKLPQPDLVNLHGHPDTLQMTRHGLLPLSTVTPWAVRTDRFIRDLAARDLWAAGRGVVDDIEYREELAQRRKERQRADRLNAINGEAFRSLQFQNGSAIALGTSKLQHGRLPRRRVMGRPFDKLDHKSVISTPSPRQAPGAPDTPRIVIAS
jgi:hypothetical protein